MTVAAYPRPRLWQPLDADASESRILCLDKVDYTGEPLRATLQAWSLARYPRYDAISWAWGQPGPMSSIVINAIEWLIPAKLDACLRRLAAVSRERTFWVDAICVDQSNPIERAQQVRMMEQIFSNANSVCVWLGSGQNTGHLTGLLEDLRRRVVRDDQTGSYQFHVSSRYFAEDWWYRVWPMQEIILARHLKLVDDKEIMDFELLRDTAQQLLHDVAQEKIPSVPHINHLLWLADFRARTHLAQVDACAHFAELLHHSRIRGTADPRDRVYGLLGVCTFLFGKDFLQPDYDEPLAMVYRQLACRLVDKTHSSAFLNQVVPLHHTSTAIPSWVPDLGARYDHEPEVLRLPASNRYRASSSLDSKYTVGHPYRDCNGSLILHRYPLRPCSHRTRPVRAQAWP